MESVRPVLIDKQPCLNCKDRHPACHDHCERHKAAIAYRHSRQRPKVLVGSPEDAFVGYLADKKRK